MPPTALCELPFPASVVNTSARKRNGLRAVGGGDRRRLAGARNARRESFQEAWGVSLIRRVNGHDQPFVSF